MKPETTNNNILKATSSQLLYICKLDPSLNIESLKDLSVTAASKMIYRLKADKRTATYYANEADLLNYINTHYENASDDLCVIYGKRKTVKDYFKPQEQINYI